MMWWTTPAPGIECAKRGSLNNESPEGVVHMQVSTIGVDLAKNVFQVHGVDNAGKVVITRALQAIVDQLAAPELQIGALDRAIHAHHRANDMSCRLETVPGIGAIGATAIASTVTDPSNFKSGRDFAAWIGLVP